MARKKGKDRKTLKQRLRSWLWDFLLADGLPKELERNITLTVDGKSFIDGVCDGFSSHKSIGNRFAGIVKLLSKPDPITTDDSGGEVQRTAEDTRR